MPRRAVAILVLLCATLATPAAAHAATRPDARAFTKATLAFDLTRGKAVGRAERRGDIRRRNATQCLETLRAAPSRRRDELYVLYLTWVSAGYFAEDQPIFDRWVRALRRIPTDDPALQRARTTLERQLSTARAIFGQGRRFCSPVEAWAQAGWKERATPPAVQRLESLLKGMGIDRLRSGVNPAARVLGRLGGEGGALAADVLRSGIDEPDSIVVKRDDQIIALLEPPL